MTEPGFTSPIVPANDRAERPSGAREMTDERVTDEAVGAGDDDDAAMHRNFRP